jgi:hypothetical protein
MGVTRSGRTCQLISVDLVSIILSMAEQAGWQVDRRGCLTHEFGVFDYDPDAGHGVAGIAWQDDWTFHISDARYRGVIAYYSALPSFSISFYFLCGILGLVGMS